MGILSSIWRLITKIFSAIFSWLADFLGDWFLVLLILVLIWFAPVIAVWLTSVGAPAFMITMFEAISVLTPYLVSAGTWLWKGGSALVSGAWSAYQGLGVGTQAAIALGAAAMIAPEETAAVIADAADIVATGVGAIGGGVLEAITSSPVGLAVLGLGVWWFFLRGKRRDEKPQELTYNQEQLA